MKFRNNPVVSIFTLLGISLFSTEVGKPIEITSNIPSMILKYIAVQKMLSMNTINMWIVLSVENIKY